jgi:hypothetical protein
MIGRSRFNDWQCLEGFGTRSQAEQKVRITHLIDDLSLGVDNDYVTTMQSFNVPASHYPNQDLRHSLYPFFLWFMIGLLV